MPNLLQNPGFEDPTAAPWVLVADLCGDPGGAAILTDPPNARSGSKVLKLSARNALIGPVHICGEAHQQVSGLVIGTQYQLDGWYKAPTVNNNRTLQIQHPGGTVVVNTPTSVYLPLPTILFTATAAVHTLIYQTQEGTPGGAQVDYFLDDLLLEEVVPPPPPGPALLVDALLQDLQGIQVSEGFQTSVRRVYRRPIAPATLEVPAIVLNAPKEAESESSNVRASVHALAQRWRLELLVRSPDPVGDVMKLKDDVRNALERPGSAVRAFPGVSRVDVVAWSEPLTDEDLDPGWGSLAMDVEVTFLQRLL